MKKKLLISGILFFGILQLQAHTINYTLNKMDDGQVFWQYLQQGFLHILPLGLDHILFIPVSYTHLRAHETVLDIVCRLLLEKKK